MATIDDFGSDPADTLNTPPLGGPAGWAAAVRDAITANIAAIAGKVSKTGDTMTGGLVAPDVGANTVSIYTDPTLAAHATHKGYVDSRVQGGLATSDSGGIAYVDFDQPFTGDPYAVTVTSLVGAVGGNPPATAALPTIRSVGPTGFGFSLVNPSDQYIVQNCFWIAIGPR